MTDSALSLLGLALRGKFSEELGNAIMKGIGLANLGMGMASLLGTADFMGVIICMVVGTLIGEKVNIERAMDRFGDLLRRKFVKGEGNSRFVEGFVNATVLFCVGAMTIVGALNDGLTGNHEMLFTKATLDFVSSIVFASSLGIGVMLSAAAVLVIEGGVACLASLVAPFLQQNANTVPEMTVVGSILIIGISLNLLGITKLKVMNYVPAIFLPILLCMFM